MKNNFDTCDTFLVSQIEGGYVVDNGGPTKYGCTIPFIADWWKKIGKAGTPDRADIENLSAADAKAARKALCWDACQCDDLPPGVDFAVYDAAVNSGAPQAAKWLQRNLLVAPDGIIGPKTIAGAKIMHPVGIINAICLSRMEDMGKFSAWPTAGHGWSCRVLKVQAYATGFAR